MEGTSVVENAVQNCNKHRKLSTFISLILRHKPEVIGIELDSHGWADVNELIHKINFSGKNKWYIDPQDLDEIVEGDEKQRYSYNADKTKIRANQGHSVHVDLELNPLEPPCILFHGTSIENLKKIAKTGICKMSRQYVHLSSDIETAIKVGSRHGTPVVITISSFAMYNDDIPFYLSENDVWLTEHVPVEYCFMRVEDALLLSKS